MNSKHAMIAVFTLGFATLVAAVTEQWHITLTDMGNDERAQIVADGKGGCALLYISTNDITGLTILWIDKKQRTIYRKEFNGDYAAIAIRSCDGKQLTYMHGSDPSSIVVVDVKGMELISLATLGGWLDAEGANTARLAWQLHKDKKGIFTLVNTATEGDDPVYQLKYSKFK